MNSEPRRPQVKDEPEERGRLSPEPASGAPGPTTSSRPPGDARFVGQAMKSLFESADVSIARGDETRVLSRAQQTLAELDRREPSPADARAPTHSSTPPGPRVDAVLWIVLATGLLAIAGWMIAYAL